MPLSYLPQVKPSALPVPEVASAPSSSSSSSLDRVHDATVLWLLSNQTGHTFPP